LCRVILHKPRASDIGWPEIDHRLNEVKVGEAIFNAKNESDGSSKAYLYFSAPDTTLPLSFAQQQE
jgi:hypothetical protein